MDQKVFAYDFYEGNKGVVFASCEEIAMDKVKYVYGTEYCACHELEIREAEMWDIDVFCTENTWN